MTDFQETTNRVLNTLAKAIRVDHPRVDPANLCDALTEMTARLITLYIPPIHQANMATAISLSFSDLANKFRQGPSPTVQTKGLN